MRRTTGEPIDQIGGAQQLLGVDAELPRPAAHGQAGAPDREVRVDPQRHRRDPAPRPGQLRR